MHIVNELKWRGLFPLSPEGPDGAGETPGGSLRGALGQGDAGVGVRRGEDEDGARQERGLPVSAVAAPAAVMVPAPRPAVDDAVAVTVLPGLFVPEARQWLSTSAGRTASDGYCWMQAVHRVAGSGLYQPRRHRSHGPRSFGATTARVAQERRSRPRERFCPRARKGAAGQSPPAETQCPREEPNPRIAAHFYAVVTALPTQPAVPPGGHECCHGAAPSAWPPTAC
ncbi:hypothetical protein GCM10018785_71490 [Streptomyces longispororuber]|uniref:Uncharacterized protein n=1 Tax=Streptomyces longispororuber TaxID=68230 RepID=A0A919DZY1_9ACTN|nr:hypothetical protein GCM10018785_71490 [Streptomyces longispororuber]